MSSSKNEIGIIKRERKKKEESHWILDKVFVPIFFFIVLLSKLKGEKNINEEKKLSQTTWQSPTKNAILKKNSIA